MENNNEFRKLIVAAGREIQAGGNMYLFFGGTAYLGLTQHPAFMELYIKGLYDYGINNGTSRNNNVQTGIYDEAEDCAARRFGAEAALITSSGFLAAQMVVKHLSLAGELLYAPGCHPALWLNGQPDATGNYQEWALKTVQYINNSTGKNFVVVSNTFNNLQPEKYDLSVFSNILGDRPVHFLLDHSHGLGILENNALPANKNFRVTVVASMAKALGIDAGVVLADRQMVQALKQSPVFPGASPPAPAGMYAFIHAGDIYKEQYELLLQNTRLFQQQIRSHCQYIQDFPVFYFPDSTLYHRLITKNIIISGFPYPLPDSALLNRVVISSVHTKEDIEKLVRAIDINN